MTQNTGTDRDTKSEVEQRGGRKGWEGIGRGWVADATVVLTDSGGVQEETTALGVPCLTLRDNTERPITVEHGTNVVVGRNRDLILSLVEDVVRSGGKRGQMPELWDGRAADRIVEHLARWALEEPAVDALPGL